MNSAVLVHHGYLLDGVKQHHGSVVGMQVEGAGRLLPVLGLVLLVELFVVHSRGAGEVHTLSRLAGRLDEVGRDHAVGAHQHGLLQAGHLFGLLGDQSALLDEDRVIEHIGVSGRDLGQHRAHVGIANVDGLLSHAFAAQLGEDIASHLLQLLGVGATIVNGRHSPRTEHLVGKFGHGLALHFVVVGSAQVALGVGLRRSQRGRSVGGRNHGDVSIRKDLGCRLASAGAVGADHAHNGLVGRQLLRGGLAALGGALGVFLHHLNGVLAFRKPILVRGGEVIHGDFNAAQ